MQSGYVGGQPFIVLLVAEPEKGLFYFVEGDIINLL